MDERAGLIVETTQRFDRDLRKLTGDQRQQFRDVLAAEFIPGLKAQPFHLDAGSVPTG
ncbi:MAG: hypothetical protein JO281_03310 [Pseudonocardiales bacterium]|nr:hypothetical protein [Pseudonocardiales bacterium]